jgi:hypothetical protein
MSSDESSAYRFWQSIYANGYDTSSYSDTSPFHPNAEDWRQEQLLPPVA